MAGSLSSRTLVVAPDIAHCLLAYGDMQEGTVRFRSCPGSPWYGDLRMEPTPPQSPEDPAAALAFSCKAAAPPSEVTPGRFSLWTPPRLLYTLACRMTGALRPQIGTVPARRRN